MIRTRKTEGEEGVIKAIFWILTEGIDYTMRFLDKSDRQLTGVLAMKPKIMNVLDPDKSKRPTTHYLKKVAGIPFPPVILQKRIVCGGYWRIIIGRCHRCLSFTSVVSSSIS